jgi:hypothetical protein
MQRCTKVWSDNEAVYHDVGGSNDAVDGSRKQNATQATTTSPQSGQQ